jgi:flagellar hook-associated protein 2
MSVSGINFSGLQSGIDTESIISKLLDLERRPQQILKNNQSKLIQMQTAYGGITAQLLGLQSASSALNRLKAFDVVTAKSSNEEAVTVTAESGAQTGSHTIAITHLAQAQKISTSAQSSKTNPLGFSGQILLNGKSINVAASDSLETLAASINSAQAGVSASIISPSANEFYLTLGSANTGLQGRISISDTQGGAFLASTLGLFTANESFSLRNPIGATGAASNLFTDSGSAVGNLQGQTAPLSGNIKIEGVTVKIDLATDSLTAIAANINQAAIPGVSATVISVNDPFTKETRYQLQINGSQKFEDDNNVLANLGVIQRDYTKELTEAQDAEFTIDGLPAKRPTNSFTDVISGVTLTLLKENATSTIEVNTDISTIKSNISSFVKTFNDTLDLIASHSQFDPVTSRTGPLFGDGAMQSVVDGLISSVSGEVRGLPNALSTPGSLTILAQVGITLNQNARLVVNEQQLTDALTNNRANVAKLFQAYGTASDPLIQFVSSTDKTQASGTDGYVVNITQAATQATVVADVGQTGALADDEVLTFGGALFGASKTAPITGGRQIHLAKGSTLSDVVSQINADSVIGKVISASIDDVTGKLKLTSKGYGSKMEFAVVSGVAASANSTGIGTTVVVQSGKNVEGTINGELARGDGQFLTGAQVSLGSIPAGKALGLQLRVTASAAGTYGNIRFSSGIADLTRNYITTQTDAFSGVLTTGSGTLQTQIKDIDDTLKTLEARVKETETNLRLKFAAMEGALVRINSAKAGLAQLAALGRQ